MKNWIISLIALLTTTMAQAETVTLLENEVVRIALEENPEMHAYHLGKQARLTGIAEEEAKFGRQLGVSVSHSDNRQPSVSSLEGVPTTSTNAQTMALSLSQKIKTGGQFDLTFSQSRSSNNAGFRTINPVYDSDVEVTFSQPLLRGRGLVNQIGLDIAQNDLKNAGIDLEGYQRDLKASVRTAYWNLVLAREGLKVKQQRYDGRLRVLETVNARVKMGVEARNSILQAELGVAQSQDGIIAAEDRVYDAEDRLKTFMRWTDQQGTQIIPTDRPTIAPFGEKLELGIQRAMENNAAFKRTRVRLNTHELLVKQAKDQTLPEINLNLRAGLSGIGSNYSDELKGLGDGDGRSWLGGFSIDLPLGTSVNRSRYQQQLMAAEQAQLRQEYQRMQLIESVRERFRQVRTNRRRSDVVQLAEKLAARNVKEEEERLAMGLSTVRNVLDAQDDLAEEQANLLGARIDHRLSIIAYDRITGNE
jgi:outer membrane protein TolC